MNKKLVITGGAGYIGSVLTQQAIARGYEVHIVDRFFFGKATVESSGAVLHQSDTREIDPRILEGAYGVLDLAAISNDPAGELNPEVTLDINYRARRRLQELCNTVGVQRYVLASSCSVYGFQDEAVDEESPVNPLTTYAQANVLAEKSAFSNSKGATTFTALRQATVFGLSPRMRFDLVVNAMTRNLLKDRKLKILRDGSQWRPMVHVRDTSRAFLDVLEAPSEMVDDQVFNTGGNSHNFQVIGLAEQISEALGVELELEWYGDPDARSYKVDFSKIKDVIGFEPEWGIADAAKEIGSALEQSLVDDGPRSITLGWYQHLEQMQQQLREIEINGRLLN